MTGPEDLAAAEREAERQREAAERAAAERAADRFLGDLDRALSRPDLAPRTEMGQGPEISAPSPWHTRDLDRGYSVERGPLPPPAPARPLDERMLELKRDQLQQGLTAPHLTAGSTPPAPEVIPLRHDSPERREAVQRAMERAGVDPHLRAIRDLMERGSGQPPHAAVAQPPRMTSRRTAPGRGYGTEREREERERGW